MAKTTHSPVVHAKPLDRKRIVMAKALLYISVKCGRITPISKSVRVRDGTESRAQQNICLPPRCPMCYAVYRVYEISQHFYQQQVKRGGWASPLHIASLHSYRVIRNATAVFDEIRFHKPSPRDFSRNAPIKNTDPTPLFIPEIRSRSECTPPRRKAVSNTPSVYATPEVVSCICWGESASLHTTCVL
ncbi:hypothetical protein J6590_033481 [Homalodisca vitripennis]|nr:hypothetical protein J6590_033481 [Homalodisca vitripennis]